MMKSQILVVEDDVSMQALYCSILGRHHKEEFNLRLEETGEGGLRFLHQHDVDLVILDWCLPKLSGLDVLRSIRVNQATRDLLVFMVTGQGNVQQRVKALEGGADDYLTKPFAVDELVARVRGLLRRREISLERHEVFELDDFKLDPRSGEVTVAGKPVHLAPKQRELLRYFLTHPDSLHTPAQLGEAVWGYATDSVLYHISELRRLLGPKWGARLVTIRGEGYLLDTRL